MCQQYIFSSHQMYVDLLLDKPINTMMSVFPPNPRLNQLIQVSCSAVANPAVTMYNIYVNETSLGPVFMGNNLTVNVSDCLTYSGYFKCIPLNGLGEGVQANQLIVVKGML